MLQQAAIASYLYTRRSELGSARIEALRNRLTVTPKYDTSGNAIELFDDHSAVWFGVPLFDSPKALTHAETLADRVADFRVTHTTLFGVRSMLRNKQQDVFNAFVEHLEQRYTGFLIEAKPGFGKTVVCIHMLSHLSQRTLVVVPRSNLIGQWVERLLMHSTLKRREIGTVEGRNADWRGKKVVVGLVHSLALDYLGADFRKQFGCVVFDEVDRSVPPQTFAPLVARFPAKFRIGMSATIRRQDGMEIVFEKHIAQCHLRADDEGRMAPKVAMIYYDQSSGFVPVGLEMMKRRGILLSRLSDNYHRTRVISNYTHKIWQSGRRCVVLSDRKRQLKSIFRVLVGDLKVPKETIGFYVRSLDGRTIKEHEKTHMASRCDILLATYGMISIGTDIPDLAGLVYATPQSEVEQSRGRIERFVHDKKQPVIIDIVDSAYYDAMLWAKKRFNNYRRAGLDVKSISVGRGRG